VWKNLTSYYAEGILKIIELAYINVDLAKGGEGECTLGHGKRFPCGRM
jgi:hypothetical protein